MSVNFLITNTISSLTKCENKIDIDKIISFCRKNLVDKKLGILISNLISKLTPLNLWSAVQSKIYLIFFYLFLIYFLFKFIRL